MKPGAIAQLTFFPVLLTSDLLVAESFFPAIAHNVEIANDVAVTMHIEPNHNPKAGEPSLAWFALTRKGGQLVPAGECACQLNVYSEPYKAGTPPILQQTLTGINAEQYRDIPGSTVTFPKAGQYILEITGKPKGEASFTPFALRYTVTVTGGTPITSPNSVKSPLPSVTTTQPTVSPATQPHLGLPLVIGVIVAITLGTVALWLIRQRKKG